MTFSKYIYVKLIFLQHSLFTSTKNLVKLKHYKISNKKISQSLFSAPKAAKSPRIPSRFRSNVFSSLLQPLLEAPLLAFCVPYSVWCSWFIACERRTRVHTHSTSLNVPLQSMLTLNIRVESFMLNRNLNETLQSSNKQIYMTLTVQKCVLSF